MVSMTPRSIDQLNGRQALLSLRFAVLLGGREAHSENLNENSLVATTGFEPVYESGHVFASFSGEFGNSSRPESRPD